MELRTSLYDLIDSGILDDLPSSTVASVVGLTDDESVSAICFDDFVGTFAKAVAARVGRVASGEARGPAVPPARVPAKSLRDTFASACVDFESIPGVHVRNTETLTLPQWRRLCIASGFVSRRFTSNSVDLVFAKTRTLGETTMKSKDFPKALAWVALETGKTLESVVDACAKCSDTKSGGGRSENFERVVGGTLEQGERVARSAEAVGRSSGGLKQTVSRSINKQPTRRNSVGAGKGKVTASCEQKITKAPDDSASSFETFLSSPRESDFDASDADNDGLLTPNELIGVLVLKGGCDEGDAVDLVSKLFNDVDLDKDGRVCFDEFTAFCKKAKRVLRRRTFSTFTVDTKSSRLNTRTTMEPTRQNNAFARPATARCAVPSGVTNALGPATRVLRPASAAPASVERFAEREEEEDTCFPEAVFDDLSEEVLDPEQDVFNETQEATFEVSRNRDELEVPVDVPGIPMEIPPVTVSEKETESLAETETEKLETKLRVWRAEFDQQLRRYGSTDYLDLELCTFSLAKLRLLENISVSVAALTLEAYLSTFLAEKNNESCADVDESNTDQVCLDFAAFCRFAKALEDVSTRHTEGAASTASTNPVPVAKEYVFDPTHKFLILFNELADSNFEINGELFGCLLRAAQMTDDLKLTETGVDVMFARARARHQGKGRAVPYRIFLGALSLAAGHLGMDFETAATRVMNGAEAARARAVARADPGFEQVRNRADEEPSGKENTSLQKGKKKKTRLSEVFVGR